MINQRKGHKVFMTLGNEKGVATIYTPDDIPNFAISNRINPSIWQAGRKGSKQIATPGGINGINHALKIKEEL